MFNFNKKKNQKHAEQPYCNNQESTFTKETFHNSNIFKRIGWAFELSYTPNSVFPFISYNWHRNVHKRHILFLLKIALKLGNSPFIVEDYSSYVLSVEVFENIDEMIELTYIFLAYTDMHRITCLSSLLFKLKAIRDHTNISIEFTEYEKEIIHHFLYMIKFRNVDSCYHNDYFIL